MKIYDFKGRKNVCGKNIRRMRMIQGITQAELAAKCQVEELMMERDSISRIELGTRFVADYELYIIAHVLETSMEELLEMPENN